METRSIHGIIFHSDKSEAVKKRVAILGSTGSIGTQALNVIRAHPGLFEVEVLTAHSNSNLLIAQAAEFLPNAVVIGQKEGYDKVAAGLRHLPVKVWNGSRAIADVVTMDSIDLVLSAMVGFSGLIPTFHALKAGKDVALANKESLVIAGELVTKEAIRHHARIIPVDSEHSAIFQCLAGEQPDSVEKIYLTASGGPFRGKTATELAGVTREQALAHPNWKMGSKITIDSASLMNKGLEVIEARWLFGLEPWKIDVIVHPQSVIHSIVQFVDGSMKAQMGLPDMHLPILYALSYPGRIPSGFKRFDFLQYPNLSFELPDRKVFRNLDLSLFALERGGNATCVLNAANESAVFAFLQGRIGFLQMSDLIESCLEKVSHLLEPGLEELVDTHYRTMEVAETILRHGN